MKRKMIDEKRSVNLYEVEGKLVDVRKYIDELIAEYGEEAKLEIEWDYDDVSLMLNYQRLETELQAAKRIDKAQKAAATRKRNRLKKEEAAHKELDKLEEIERKELARLKAKYGN